jgi:hypothetical protein
MAAPFVSGTAALLLAQDPGQSMGSVRDRLLRTAVPLAGAGSGRLDVLAALRAGQSRTQAAGTITGSADAGVTPSVAAPRTTTDARPIAARPAAGMSIGPIQLLAILVVGGVALAVATTIATRRHRSG